MSTKEIDDLRTVFKSVAQHVPEATRNQIVAKVRAYQEKQVFLNRAWYQDAKAKLLSYRVPKVPGGLLPPSANIPFWHTKQDEFALQKLVRVTNANNSKARGKSAAGKKTAAAELAKSINIFLEKTKEKRASIQPRNAEIEKAWRDQMDAATTAETNRLARNKDIRAVKAAEAGVTPKSQIEKNADRTASKAAKEGTTKVVADAIEQERVVREARMPKVGKKGMNVEEWRRYLEKKTPAEQRTILMDESAGVRKTLKDAGIKTPTASQAGKDKGSITIETLGRGARTGGGGRPAAAQKRQNLSAQPSPSSAPVIRRGPAMVSTREKIMAGRPMRPGMQTGGLQGIGRTQGTSMMMGSAIANQSASSYTIHSGRGGAVSGGAPFRFARRK